MKKITLFILTIFVHTNVSADSLWTDVYIGTLGFSAFEFVTESGINKTFTMSADYIDSVEITMTSVAHLESAVESVSQDSQNIGMKKAMPILNNCVDDPNLQECSALPLEINEHEHFVLKHPIILGIYTTNGETGIFFRNINIIKALIGSNKICNDYKEEHPDLYDDVEFLVPFYDLYDGFIEYKTIEKPPYYAPILHFNHTLPEFEFSDDVTFKCVIPRFNPLLPSGKSLPDS